MRELLQSGLDALGYENNPQAVDKLMQFCQLLLERNKVMNLTGAMDAHEVVVRHFLDCAAALRLMDPTDKSVLDVGCGAGFPGMPLALLFPSCKVTLLDSLGKRITFLNECLDKLAVRNAQAVHNRAEEYPDRETFDLVTSRAVAELRILAELCLPLVRVGGQFAAMKSTACDEELERALPAIHLLGGHVEAIHDYTIPESEGIQQRVVHIRKLSETPRKYPRRFAKITSSPLR